MSNQNTQLSLRNEIESPAFKDAVAKVLPKILPPDRFVRVAITAMTRTPKLRECDRASFFSAMLSLAQTGLEPDGRRAHLIPFENRKRGVVECQLIIDYKGLAELAMRSGLLSYLHADVVRDGDIFDYSLGEIREHIPHYLRRDQGKPEKSGNVYAAYAVARFKDGSAKAEVMSVDEVNAIRSRSRACASDIHCARGASVQNTFSEGALACAQTDASTAPAQTRAGPSRRCQREEDPGVKQGCVMPTILGTGT